MNTKNKTSLNAKIILPLILFFIIVLALVWISEVFLFGKAYENHQLKVINKIGDEIRNSKESNVDAVIEANAYKNQVCIIKTNLSYTIERYNTKITNCVFEQNNPNISAILNDFIESGSSVESYKLSPKTYNRTGYIYAIKYSDKQYIFIYSNLKDTSSVTTIIKDQMIYVTIIAIIMAILISYFLTKRITKPILDITKKAKHLGSDPNIKFDESNIKEIDELSTTLNFAQSEIGKTTQLQQELLANVSHDLKTPLTMIKAYAEMISDISYKDKKKMNEHLDIIKEESDRLTNLVNDILDLSKLQSNATNLSIEKYDIVKEIKGIIKRYDIIKETENYNFILEAPSKLMVNADKNKINQVIYNLINNAINYTGKDKIVTIKVLKDKTIQIIDTGKGIEKAKLDTIWNRYYKTDKKHKRNVVSTGLGLSIVKEILIKHDFEYGVTSSKKGTTFYFKLK